jgi:FKBP-type peptidyl-prolyl cis-trans isomerase FkpA/FKBP-type peptidyl-prolyl cis-trans isomerase FklB
LATPRSFHYTLGLATSHNLAPLEFSEAELAVIQSGIADGVLGRDQRVDAEAFGPKIQNMLQARALAATQREKDAGAEFSNQAAAEPGAVKTDSGVIFLGLEPGDGPSPGPTDTVRVHYHGTLRDGEVFDSSLDGDPATFAVNGVIGCFSEGLQKMKVGGKAKLTCPSDTAYGDRGSPPSIRPGATLVFEIQLVEIVTPAAAETPSVP